MLSSETLAKARALFPYTASGRIYLNHAATAPLSTPVVDAMNRHLHDRSLGRLETYWEDLPMFGECRDRVRQLINAESPERISLQVNTTDALNTVASGLQWKTGDRILLCSAEFPANVYPYLNLRRLGAELDFMESRSGAVTPEMILRHLTPRTRLLALSAVQFLSGYRADLAEIGTLCRCRDIIFAVDGIQAVGAVCVDVQGMKIDAMAAGSQKWQLAPHGAGFLYLSEALQSRIAQAHLGWLSVDDPWQFYNYDQPLAPGARRYEGGSLVTPSLWGMHAALGMLLEFDPVAIEDQVLGLTDMLLNELLSAGGLEVVTPTDRPHRAGIVTVSVPGTIEPTSAWKKILQRDITTSLREGKIRISPHFYNTPEEMRTAASAVIDCLGSR